MQKCNFAHVGRDGPLGSRPGGKEKGITGLEHPLLNQRAKLSKARIVRQVNGGTQEIPIPLDKIVLSKAPDVPLMAEDIVFIPNNTAREMAGKVTQTAVALASGVIIVGSQRF